MSEKSQGATLGIMAAGMGSRYGGLKQLDPVGPSGEVMLEYSVFDAIRAGFDTVAFIIRREFEADFRRDVVARFEDRCRVALVFQSLADLPDGLVAPPDRRKPWGTAHAVLRLESAVRTPFCVINADDFYGRASFETARRFLASVPAGDARPLPAAMIGYRLGNTLSEHGGVARGLCRIDPAGNLERVEEIDPIVRTDGGDIEFQPAGAPPVALTGAELVSMNFWAFAPGIFTPLGALFAEFLQRNADRPAAEFLLPHAVDSLVRRREASVAVLACDSPWFGVTYREDKPRVQQSIRRLVDAGQYPSPLWTDR